MIGMILDSVLPPIFRINEATLVIIPVLSRPAPIIMTAIIDMTALEEKPSNSLCVSTRPVLIPITGENRVVKPRSTIIVAAATSTSTISKANKYIVRSKKPITQATSIVGTTVAI